MMDAGPASRLELYGLLLLAVIVVSLMCERMAIDREIINTIVRDQQRPNIVQNNNQQVTIEDPRERLIRELALQKGWKLDVNRSTDAKPSNAVSGAATTTSGAGSSGPAKRAERR